MMFKIGDTVIMNPQSEFSSQGTRGQIIEMLAIVHSTGNFNYKVRWYNGHTNNYRDEDLLSELPAEWCVESGDHYESFPELFKWRNKMEWINNGFIHNDRIWSMLSKDSVILSRKSFVDNVYLPWLQSNPQIYNNSKYLKEICYA